MKTDSKCSILIACPVCEMTLPFMVRACPNCGTYLTCEGTGLKLDQGKTPDILLCYNTEGGLE